MTEFNIKSLDDNEEHYMVSLNFALSHYKIVCHSLNECIEKIVEFANEKGLYDVDGKQQFQLIKQDG